MENTARENYYAHLVYANHLDENEIYCYFLNRDDIGCYKQKILSLLDNNEVSSYKNIIRREINSIKKL